MIKVLPFDQPFTLVSPLQAEKRTKVSFPSSWVEHQRQGMMMYGKTQGDWNHTQAILRTPKLHSTEAEMETETISWKNLIIMKGSFCGL